MTAVPPIESSAMFQPSRLIALGMILLLAGCSMFTPSDNARRLQYQNALRGAREALDAGRLQQALDRINHLIEDKNHDDWYYHFRDEAVLLRAQIDEAVGKYDYAARWYVEYARLKPTVDLSVPVARVAAKQRTLELSGLAEQIAAHPEDPSPRLERVRILGLQLDHLRWDSVLRKQADCTTSDRALVEADFDRLKTMLSLADLQLARTHYYFSQQDFANAGLSAMAATVARPEGDWFPYYALGVCVEAQEPDLAIGSYLKAIELLPAQANLGDRPEVFMRCASLLVKRFEQTHEVADTERATQLMNSLIELEPDFANAWIMLSKIAMARGDYDAAYLAASKALEHKCTPEAEGHYLCGMAATWTAFPPGTLPDPSEEGRQARRPACLLARRELEAATDSKVYSGDARVHWILAAIYNDILDVRDDDSKTHWKAQAHARSAAELDPKLPPVDLWRADQLQAYQDERRAERSERLGLLMAGIDPNTGQRIQEDAPAPTRSWADDLREIDWSQAPGNSGDFGAMVDANQAVGAQLQRQIDSDASWSKFKNELEQHGHTGSRPR